ncbi:MAG: TRAP transporter substrate-binding protein [Clostridiales bacterium]|nr:TRAP transporter substrate-binding protein [Clostridiales bacterium]
MGEDCKKRRTYFLLTILMGALILAGCSSQGQIKETEFLFRQTETEDHITETPELVIYLTHSESEDSFTNWAAQELKKQLESLSQGQMILEIYADDTLGSVKEADYMLKENQVQMRIGSGPSRSMFYLTYPLLTGMEISELMDAWMGGQLDELFAWEGKQNGTRIIGVLPPEYRVLTSNQAVHTLEELETLRVRTAGHSVTSTYWECQGAVLVEMPLTEVYLAMQQGIVDANADGTIRSMISNRFYLQQNYVIETKHQIYLEPLYVSESFYQKLTEEQRTMLENAVTAMEDACRERQTEIDEENRKFLEEQGIQFLSLPEEEREKMEDLAYDDMNRVMEELLGEELFEKLRLIFLHSHDR